MRGSRYGATPWVLIVALISGIVSADDCGWRPSVSDKAPTGMVVVSTTPSANGTVSIAIDVLSQQEGLILTQVVRGTVDDDGNLCGATTRF